MKVPNNALEAIYTEAQEGCYKGNPFIEALPPKVSTEQLKAYLTRNCDEEFLAGEEEDITRIHKIVNIIGGFFQPLASHIRLEQKLSFMIRKGYVGRNINTGDLYRRLRKGYELVKSGETMVQFGDTQSTALSNVFIGGSGFGKTSVLNLLLASYPQVIFHPNYNFVQLTYIKVDCSHDGTLKGLCNHIIVALDKALGINCRHNIRQRWGVEDLVSHIAQIISSYALGVLVIDEIQNLSVAKSGGKEKMLAFFGNLVNVLNVPVLMVGTPKAKKVMMGDFMYARRSVGAGAIEWQALKTVRQRRKSSKNREVRSEWQAFTDRLWKVQFLNETNVKLTNAIRNTWFDCSQGIIDIVIKLFVFTQIRAIITKQEKISSGLMRKVYEDEFGPIHPMIDALSSGDPDRIAEYSDLQMNNTVNFLTEKEKLFKKMEEKSRKQVEQFDGNKLALELFHFLIDLKIDEKEAVTIAKKIVTDHPDKVQISELVQLALIYQTEYKKSSTYTPIRVKSLPLDKWQELESNDLRFIFASCSGDIYEELMARDLIYKLD